MQRQAQSNLGKFLLLQHRRWWRRQHENIKMEQNVYGMCWKHVFLFVFFFLFMTFVCSRVFGSLGKCRKERRNNNGWIVDLGWPIHRVTSILLFEALKLTRRWPVEQDEFAPADDVHVRMTNTDDRASWVPQGPLRAIDNCHGWYPSRFSSILC